MMIPQVSAPKCDFKSECSVVVNSENPYTTVIVYFIKLTDSLTTKVATPDLQRSSIDGQLYNPATNIAINGTASYVTSNITVGTPYYYSPIDLGFSTGRYAVFAVIADDPSTVLRYQSTQVSCQSLQICIKML